MSGTEWWKSGGTQWRKFDNRLQIMSSGSHPYEKNSSIQISYNPPLIRTKLWTKSSYYLALLHEVGHSLGLNYEFPSHGSNDEALAD
ncbi:MAG: hypothetical protein KA747_08615, partial [Ignavibacteriaceae bacterium]|nr:hypothetical protein [Ignavibacteriaceae bacterium]